ncbi:putative integral membrane protein [Rosellinia necatrix]|uniref:Putative integral membrane protein n=1 Tax=Rosellinia necatrix TaxID=77044 RepID=A0A1W2TBP1_ROSNE|nr:putative integral membrane protein [Rosellinia necatrix]
MSGYVTDRPAGREHIPLYPKGFVAVRILQLVIGIVCLGLTAYAVAIFPITGAALMLFTAIVTLLTSIYLLVAHFGPPAAYNYWAILGLDIFHVIFWLISFALLASQAALLLDIGDYYDFYYYGSAYTILGAIVAAAAGLGGVEWVLYLVALIIHSIAFHRHRKAGLHAMPAKPSSAVVVANVPGVGGAPGVEKYQMQPQQPQVYYAPPQGAVHEIPSPQLAHQQPLQYQQPQQPQYQQ